MFQRWTASALLPDPSTILTVKEYSPCLSSVPTHLLLHDTSVAFTGEWTVQSDVTASSVVQDNMMLPLVWDGVKPTHWSDGGVTSSVIRINKISCKQNNEQQRCFISKSHMIHVRTSILTVLCNRSSKQIIVILEFDSEYVNLEYLTCKLNYICLFQT